MNYIHKIHWCFRAQNKWDFKNCISVIKALGARSLTRIVLRDGNNIEIDIYNGFVRYESTIATFETINYLKKQLKNDKIQIIEIIKS